MRILQTVVHGVAIVNTYVPQGYKINTDKYVFKLEWFARIRRYFQEQLDPAKPAIWLGDMNVAPEPIDVYHPDRRVNDVDFHIDARNAYKEAVEWGFTDVFRQLHPDRVQYTYWDYFRNAFEHNWGWRIDHILATAPLAEACRACDVDLEPRKSPSASDHTVVLGGVRKCRKAPDLQYASGMPMTRRSAILGGLAMALRRQKVDEAATLVQSKVDAGFVRAASLHVRCGKDVFSGSFGAAKTPARGIPAGLHLEADDRVGRHAPLRPRQFSLADPVRQTHPRISRRRQGPHPHPPSADPHLRPSGHAARKRRPP